MQNSENLIVAKHLIIKGTKSFVAKISCNEIVITMNDFPIAILYDNTTL